MTEAEKETQRGNVDKEATKEAAKADLEKEAAKVKTFQSSIEKATVFCTEFIRRFLFKR
ncbi:TPA: hypothetical protein ACQMRA_001561 [Streptococcus pyogenes]